MEDRLYRVVIQECNEQPKDFDFTTKEEQEGFMLNVSDRIRNECVKFKIELQYINSNILMHKRKTKINNLYKKVLASKFNAGCNGINLELKLESLFSQFIILIKNSNYSHSVISKCMSTLNTIIQESEITYLGYFKMSKYIQSTVQTHEVQGF